jgi:membrane protein
MRRFVRVELGRVLRRAAYEWYEDKAPRLAAALAFYTIFSMTPMVVIAVAVGSTFFHRDQVVDLLGQAQFLIGDEGTRAIKLVIDNAPPREASTLAMALGLGMMLFAATGVFAELKDALDTIWEVRPKPGLPLFTMARDRFLSFAMVLVIGFLLLASLAASALLAALDQHLARYLGQGMLYLLQAGQLAVSFALVTLLFALVYKVLPDARVAWKDVWLGAALASVLFAVGKYLFGLYLAHSTLGSAYGAAGSLVVVCLWTYYGSLILLFGAEVSQAQARVRGERIVPAENALRLTEHDRIQEGIPRLSDVNRIARRSRRSVTRKKREAVDSGEGSSRRTRGRGKVLPALLAFSVGWLLASFRPKRD